MGSIAAGLATAMVPLAVGGALLAGDTSRDVKNAGMYVVQAGLALAPFVSHAVAREWARGALFSVVPVAAAAAAVGVMAASPDVLAGGGRDVQKGWGVAMSIAVLASAGGIVDSFWAGERWRGRLAVAPQVSRQQIGVALGGSL
jgi:hypothetical protein